MSALAFLEARDFLLAAGSDYERAYRDFRWPELDRFNWALDYFDVMARGKQHPALRLVEEGGPEARCLNGPAARPITSARSGFAAATAYC